MNDIAALHARVEALEMQVAHQERALEDLNGMVAAQWAQIDSLTREVTRLAETVRQTASQAVVSPGNEPPPPHY
jgi:SlyX protein